MQNSDRLERETVMQESVRFAFPIGLSITKFEPLMDTPASMPDRQDKADRARPRLSDLARIVVVKPLRDRSKASL